jgi:hypothetical protein
MSSNGGWPHLPIRQLQLDIPLRTCHPSDDLGDHKPLAMIASPVHPHTVG